MVQSREYLIYQVDKFVKSTGELPKQEELYRIVPEKEVVAYFGTYTNLIKAWQDDDAYKSYVSRKLHDMVRVLDRIPLQTEFEAKWGRYCIKKSYGTYNNLLKANGYMPNKDGVGRKKSK